MENQEQKLELEHRVLQMSTTISNLQNDMKEKDAQLATKQEQITTMEVQVKGLKDALEMSRIEVSRPSLSTCLTFLRSTLNYPPISFPPGLFGCQLPSSYGRWAPSDSISDRA